MIPSQAQALLDEIKKTGKKFPINESGFLASITVQVKANRLLTEKQAKFLQDIYSKAVGGSSYQPREYIR